MALMKKYYHTIVKKPGVFWLMLAVLSVIGSNAIAAPPCYKPITGNFKNAGFIVRDTICKSCAINNIKRLYDGDETNYFDLPVTYNGSTKTGVVVADTLYNYPAGYNAGFVIDLGSNGITPEQLKRLSLETYLDSVKQETGPLSLRYSPVRISASTNAVFVYFKTTKAFNAVRLVQNNIASLASIFRVHYAMAFDESCGYAENNDICDDAIQGIKTGVSVAKLPVTALGTIIDAAKIADENKSNYALLQFNSLLDTAQVNISVADNENIFPGGNNVGFVIAADGNNGKLPDAILNGLQMDTYLQGVLQESANYNYGFGKLNINGLAYSELAKIRISFKTTKKFNEVRFRITKPFGFKLDNYKIFYAYEEPQNCSGCEQRLVANAPAPHTGSLVQNASCGLLCTTVNTGTYGIGVHTLTNTDAVVSPNPDDYATYAAVVGLLNTGMRITVKNTGTLYPAGTFAGFELSRNGNLLDLQLVQAMKITLYNNNVAVATKDGSNLLSADLLSGQIKRTSIGFISNVPFNRIQLDISNALLKLALGGTFQIYRAFVVLDSDHDGNPDCIDICPGGDDSIDSDGDGIPDFCDQCKLISGMKSPYLDSDGDGVMDACDADSDNDGIADWQEDANNDGNMQNDDNDRDGIPNFLDIDSDNDGIPDLYESGLAPALLRMLDTNHDGVIDDAILKGHNGLADILELNDLPSASNNYSQPDNDGDGLKNYIDLDSDNDGISDLFESGNVNLVDENNDGVADMYTHAATKNSMRVFSASARERGAGIYEVQLDTDGNGIADCLELDSDKDGVQDIKAFGNSNADMNGDGKVDYFVDPDLDGASSYFLVDGTAREFGGIPIRPNLRPLIVQNQQTVTINPQTPYYYIVELEEVGGFAPVKEGFSLSVVKPEGGETIALDTLSSVKIDGVKVPVSNQFFTFKYDGTQIVLLSKPGVTMQKKGKVKIGIGYLPLRTASGGSVIRLRTNVPTFSGGDNSNENNSDDQQANVIIQ